MEAAAVTLLLSPDITKLVPSQKYVFRVFSLWAVASIAAQR